MRNTSAFTGSNPAHCAHPVVSERFGLFASTQPTTGLVTARTARTQRHYIEMLTAIPMPGYLLLYR